MSTNLSIEDELKVFKFKKAEIKQIEKVEPVVIYFNNLFRNKNQQKLFLVTLCLLK